jgi:hypothetical protein
MSTRTSQLADDAWEARNDARQLQAAIRVLAQSGSTHLLAIGVLEQQLWAAEERAAAYDATRREYELVQAQA